MIALNAAVTLYSFPRMFRDSDSMMRDVQVSTLIIGIVPRFNFEIYSRVYKLPRQGIRVAFKYEVMS